jgi:deoxyribose-phosphate aldolase
MKNSLAKAIEMTGLQPHLALSELETLCREALAWQAWGVCIPPFYVGKAREFMHEKGGLVCTVVGFPMGYHTINTKAEEAKRALNDGADELDMVLNLAAFKSGQWSKVSNDIQSIVTIGHKQDHRVKVIIETPLLDEDEIKRAAELCAEAEVDFVKTCTGLQGPATEAAVRLLRAHLPETIGIKASGGIRTLADARAMLEAGASRLGTSSGGAILQALT